MPRSAKTRIRASRARSAKLASSRTATGDHLSRAAGRCFQSPSPSCQICLTMKSREAQVGRRDGSNNAGWLESSWPQPASPQRASFGVALFAAPQGQPHTSPGQRPGNQALLERNSSPEGAAQTTGELVPRCVVRNRAHLVCGDVSPLQGCGLRWERGYPGRRPGLVCFGPFGAILKQRNTKTRQPRIWERRPEPPPRCNLVLNHAQNVSVGST